MHFKISNEEGELILKEIAMVLGCPDNLDRSFRTFRSVLWACRNLLPFERSLNLLEALPLSAKSIFVEHWIVKKEAPYADLTIDDLISECRRMDKHSSIQDFTTHEESVKAINAVFQVMERYSAPGWHPLVETWVAGANSDRFTD
jgi:uncharacterized protein (DUF2267 family)